MADDGNFWTGVLVTAALAGGLYYCNRPAPDITIKTVPTVNAMDAAVGAEGAVAGATTGVPTAIAPPPPPPHNYSDKEGSTYYYVAVVSEEEAKTGKAAGDVASFRYGGKDDDGAHIVFGYGTRYTCSIPCKIIKTSDGRRLAYNEGSIIGAVFQDATRGYLKAPPKPKPQQVKQEPWTGYQNDPIVPESSEGPPTSMPQGGAVPTVQSVDTAQ